MSCATISAIKAISSRTCGSCSRTAIVWRRFGLAIESSPARVITSSRILIRGRYLHVEELITTRSERSNGIGRCLLQALIQEARDLHCQALALECGLRNSSAHRFYFREGLSISAFRFAVAFDTPSGSE